MNKINFETILPMITADVIYKIMAKYNIEEDKAINDFCKSKLYELLEKEETKVWQYSGDMMLELYNREKEGCLIFPEV